MDSNDEIEVSFDDIELIRWAEKIVDTLTHTYSWEEKHTLSIEYVFNILKIIRNGK